MNSILGSEDVQAEMTPHTNNFQTQALSFFFIIVTFIYYLHMLISSLGFEVVQRIFHNTCWVLRFLICIYFFLLHMTNQLCASCF